MKQDGLILACAERLEELEAAGLSVDMVRRIIPMPGGGSTCFPVGYSKAGCNWLIDCAIRVATNRDTVAPSAIESDTESI